MPLRYLPLNILLPPPVQCQFFLAQPLGILTVSECWSDRGADFMRVEYTKGERASKELILLHRQTSEAASGRKMKAAVRIQGWTGS